MDSRLHVRLANQIARGDAILFTGAGFSLAATSKSGKPIPGSRDLRNLLWPIAFPGADVDEASTLGDVFAVAIEASHNQVGTVLAEALTTDPERLPSVYQLWFAAPWHRMYTLNIDDLEVAAGRRFPLARNIKSISALKDEPPPPTGDLVCVHLNGRLSDFPNVTFSETQYGARAAYPDAWYQLLAAELISKPIVFVGAQLDEPPLWQHLEIRRAKSRRDSELRPGSYLVTPDLPIARREVLRQFNVDWIPMGQEEFATTVLAALSDEYAAGHAAIKTRLGQPGGRVLLRSVSELRVERARGDEAEYLLGRQPSWSDITDGYAVERVFEKGLKEQLDKERPSLLVLTGTAGTGQSTTLMRLALKLDAEGRHTYWLDPNTSLAPWEIRKAVKEARPQVLVVDDIDRFGDSTGALLADLARDGATGLIISAARSTRYEGLQIESQLQAVHYRTVTVPNLEDLDIDLLIDALTKANRLGQLKGLDRARQVEILREKCGRQLLVAMIEATSGEKFEAKIERECRELGPDLGRIYATLAVVTVFRQYLTRDEILLAINDPTNEALNKLESLVKRHLVIVRNGEYQLRHRIIAERAMDYYQAEGHLGIVIRGLVFSLATKVPPQARHRSREAKLLRRLLNHDWLLRTLEHVSAVRRVYEPVEALLSWDYHYWLQRGSVEVEEGDLPTARNFLGQALSLAPEDYLVQTEWAYLLLKEASKNPQSSGAGERVEQALTDLETAITMRGDTDSYPYHVMGSQGLMWSRRAHLSKDDRKRLLDRLRGIVADGTKKHPLATELHQLLRDLEKEKLMLAFDDGTPKDADTRIGDVIRSGEAPKGKKRSRGQPT